MSQLVWFYSWQATLARRLTLGSWVSVRHTFYKCLRESGPALFFQVKSDPVSTKRHGTKCVVSKQVVESRAGPTFAQKSVCLLNTVRDREKFK